MPKKAMDRQNTKILVVEDDEQYRVFLVELLESLGFQVASSKNGSQCISNLSSMMPDLLITDLIMPDIEGIELIMAIREVDSSVPIIAISGGNLGDSDCYLDIADKVGASTCLNKPFSTDELIATIDALLTA